MIKGKTVYFKIFVFTILYSIPILISAQEVGSIKGKIIDTSTKEALFGANVIIKGTSMGAATDFDGNYIIRNVPAGNHTLEISYIGYNPKSIDLNVVANRVLNIDVELEFKVIEGDVVVVTGQAQGQIQAINQQLSSNTISNVVSENRIKELPDVNAAESIGRLPGVSINRSAGEANKISIRGLDPKYNTITVNGVRVPSTGGDDRSVDLSLISSNMLAGIELKKANTPDMDADALGGTVDLRLKEAEPGLKVNTSAQWGYNQLQKYYGNYNITGNISNRFLENDLGLIFNFNLDNYDRSSDKLTGNYERVDVENPQGITEVKLRPRELQLIEQTKKQGRTGGSLLIDYKIPTGKITANAFYNQVDWNQLSRINYMHVFDNRHYYNIEDRGGKTSVFTSALGFKKDLEFMDFDIGISTSATRTNNPDDKTYSFIQENGAFTTADITYQSLPSDVPKFAIIDTFNTGLSQMFVYNTKRKENEHQLQFNMKFPFHFGNNFNGYIKTGGKFRWLDRNNDEEQDGRQALQYTANTISPSLTGILRNLVRLYPEEWNWQSDSALVRVHDRFPIERVLSDYSRSNFLDGKYKLGMVPDIHLLNEMMNALKASDNTEYDAYLHYAIGSLGRDYHGIERYQAGYIMAEMNISKYFTLIPGVRYEQDYSRYNGQRFREVDNAFQQLPPIDYEQLTVTRSNDFWLPIVHLIIDPAEWLKIRLARTETLTRPDFIQYAPITQINSYQSYMRANNSKLRPSRSENYDIALSVYENYVGFFTFSGFHKKITDLIFQVGYNLNYDKGIPILDGLNIPESWVKGASPWVDTYVNNTNPAYYNGFELDWQTNFWYLPSVLKGLILNINYTRIFSKIEKNIFITQTSITKRPPPLPPLVSYNLLDTSRSARMPYQPEHILNLTLGYDFMGFSARLSYLYQTNQVTYIDIYKSLDSFTDKYSRWDLTVSQKLNQAIQLYANFSNLNAVPDVSLRGGNKDRPSYIEYYGFSMDVGLRYRM